MSEQLTNEQITRLAELEAKATGRHACTYDRNVAETNYYHAMAMARPKLLATITALKAENERLMAERDEWKMVAESAHRIMEARDGTG